jgi:hypothetical protein
MHRNACTTELRIRRPRTLFLLLTALALPACSEESPVQPEPVEPPAPEVAEVPTSELPAIDREIYKYSCPTNADGVRACPVVRWQGIDYAALSFRDNRISFAIHAWDAQGVLRSVQEFQGARYLASVEVDATAETATFTGQAERTVTLTWAELEAMR